MRTFALFFDSTSWHQVELDKPYDLLERTRQFSAEIITFCGRLAWNPEIGVIRRQLVRSATSVGANYRSARRARSLRDFIAKLSIVEEEADECFYWLQLLETLGAGNQRQLLALKDEAGQLVAIIVASKKTAREKLARRQT